MTIVLEIVMVAVFVVGLGLGLTIFALLLRDLHLRAAPTGSSLPPARRYSCVDDAAARRLPRKVFGGGPAPGDRVFRPVERPLPRLRRRPEREQRWTVYALSLLAFSVVSVARPLLLQRVQGWLPLNPTDSTAVPPALAFNTAVSFVTNTNWQNYAGESTMSHLTQMAGLAVQNFVSAAVGLAVAVALIRGLVAPPLGHDRQLLGRPDARRRRACCCRSRSWSRSCSSSQGVVQNSRAHRGHDRRGRDADDPRRSDREPGGDQGARHERRRPVQRELGAPVREPDRLHQHARDLRAAR